MKITTSYHCPEDSCAVERCTVSICLEDVSVVKVSRMLTELAKLSVDDFARLASIGFITEGTVEDEKRIESFLKDCCSDFG